MLIGTIVALSVATGAALLSRPVTAATPPVPGAVTYHYDSLGRIVQDIYPANSAAYSYDAAGNRQTSTIN